MKQRYYLISAVILGLAISLPTLKAGISLLYGIYAPSQRILYWLVIYNVVMALASLIVVVLLWIKPQIGKRGVILVLLGHTVVFLILLVMEQIGGMVDGKSVLAMLFRVIIWMMVALLVRRI